MPLQTQPLKGMCSDNLPGPLSIPLSSKFGSPLDAEQLHLKDQSGTPGDLRWRSSVSVAQLGGDDQLPLFSLTHPEQALVPTFDHLTASQCEGEGSAAGNAAVKLGAVLQLASVVHV